MTLGPRATVPDRLSLVGSGGLGTRLNILHPASIIKMLAKAAFLVLLLVFLGIIWESPTARHQFLEEIYVVRSYINKSCKQYEPWQVIAVSVGITLILFQIYQFLFCADESLWNRTKFGVFRLVRRLPFVGSKISKELEKSREIFKREFLKTSPTETYHLSLPDKGLSHEEVLQELKKMDDLPKLDWRKGRVSGCAYNCGDDITKLANEVYGRYCWTNPLHIGVFPEIRKMEAEVVRWCAQLFNGGPRACGTMTTGGTESILMAMRSYRQLGYSRGIRRPEIICSRATHAAFVKAADYFCMKIVIVPVDPLTRKVNLKKMKQAITSSTVVLIGNAPQYPYGIIDPIEEIAKLGRKYNIGVHVDCCLGGFILPFMDKAGFPIEPFDFRVEGVTSISADTHKYGFAPKGSSVILYANENLRRRQFFVATDTEIGIYPSPSMTGSRAGGIIAATWATLMYMGVDGYVKTTRSIVQTARWIASEIEKIPGLHVVGNPQACAVGFTSKEFDVYHLCSMVAKKGWELNQLQFPPGLHISVTFLHTKNGTSEQLIKDIKSCVEEIRANPSDKPTGFAAFYGSSQSISDRSIISGVVCNYMDVCLMANPSEDEKD